MSLTGLPASAIDPVSGTSLPIRARAISSWPEPMKPYSPRTSPARMVKRHVGVGALAARALALPARQARRGDWPGPPRPRAPPRARGGHGRSSARSPNACRPPPQSSVAMRRLLRNTVTRSDTSSTSSRKCEMKMKLVPSALSRRSTANRRSISGGDRAEVGSSRMMMRAPLNRTRPSSTSCCRPSGNRPHSWPGSRSIPSRCRCVLGLARHRAPAHDAGAVDRLVAEEHVLGHAQRRNDRQLLVDHADAGGQGVAGRPEMDRPAVDAHLAVIAGMDAGDDLHQRRLARAVLADEAMHLAAAGARSRRQ